MPKAKTIVRKYSNGVARLAPGFVRIKFPTKEEAITNKNFHLYDSKKNITFCDDNNSECSFPFELLGKEITALKEFNGYVKKEGEKYVLNIPPDEVEMFHSVVKIVDGTPIDPPINISDDSLEYDEKNKLFSINCKRINHDLADKIFKFIGAKLGYEITG